MKREIDQCGKTFFDILIIGAGVHGASICYKATQQGLRVLLLDKGDFCSSCSANSLKILHGGLRYLQHLDFRRMRASISSRREMMRIAPHLVEPLACIMPAYGHGLKGKEVMRVAMVLNDCIGMDRNKGLLPEKQLPHGYSLTKVQCLEKVPDISTDKLHGASVWYDALATNSERLVLEQILQAADRGATCINYCEVNSLEQGENETLTVTADDLLTKQKVVISAQHVINAAGACFEDLIPDNCRKPQTGRWARALNIVIKKNLFPDGAVALEGDCLHDNEDTEGKRKRRMLFFVPWRQHYTIIGTHYVEKSRSPKLFPVTRDDIIAMMDEVNAIYPAAKLTFEDISFYHAGLLPVREDSKANNSLNVQLAKDSSIICHEKEGGLKNFYSIKGIKYTTAPHVADRVMQLIDSSYKNKTLNDLTGRTHFPKPESSIDNYLENKYGGRYDRIKKYIDAEQQWLNKDPDMLLGELLYFIHEEMAIHLSDVVFRRSDIGTAECPRQDILHRIAGFMATEYNWSDERTAEEIRTVMQRYLPLKPNDQ